MASSPSIRTISVLGCGWFGMPLAIRLVRAGFQVNGATTTPAKRERMREHHISDFLIQLDPGLHSEARPDAFFDADALVLNIPPGRENTASRYRLMMDNLMPHITGSGIQLVIFISSTSVYPNLNRSVEESDAGGEGLSKGGTIMLETEQLLQQREEFKTTVLRFGGLYGNDRHPARYMAGRSGLSNSAAPVNLVHLEDCIRITERILRQQLGGETFNVVCDEHPNRKTYYSEMTRRMGLKKPEFVQSDDHPSEWKQVSNRYVKQKLPYSFKYKSPYEGY